MPGPPARQIAVVAREVALGADVQCERRQRDGVARPRRTCGHRLWFREFALLTCRLESGEFNHRRLDHGRTVVHLENCPAGVSGAITQPRDRLVRGRVRLEEQPRPGIEDERVPVNTETMQPPRRPGGADNGRPARLGREPDARPEPTHHPGVLRTCALSKLAEIRGQSIRSVPLGRRCRGPVSRDHLVDDQPEAAVLDGEREKLVPAFDVAGAAAPGRGSDDPGRRGRTPMFDVASEVREVIRELIARVVLLDRPLHLREQLVAAAEETDRCCRDLQRRELPPCHRNDVLEGELSTLPLETREVLIHVSIEVLPEDASVTNEPRVLAREDRQARV